MPISYLYMNIHSIYIHMNLIKNFVRFLVRQLIFFYFAFLVSCIDTNRSWQAVIMPISTLHNRQDILDNRVWQIKKKLYREWNNVTLWTEGVSLGMLSTIVMEISNGVIKFRFQLGLEIIFQVDLKWGKWKKVKFLDQLKFKYAGS